MPHELDKRQAMVIDDDPFQLKILSHLLGTLGLERDKIQTCQSGSEALERIGALKEADLLIILDLNMPGMDGVEVVRKLAERKFSGTIVLVSGEDARILETAANLAQAHNLWVLGHLDKPVQREALEMLLTR